MDLIELSLVLIVAVALIGAAARRVPIPAPLFFILGGVALSFVPHLRAIKLDPQIFFLLFIPPLLFSDGWLFPKREFLKYRHSILLLAFGLVTATVLVVGYTMHHIFPEIPLAAWFALGAVISPTDAVAVSAVTERLRLPLRMTAVLSGESLINEVQHRCDALLNLVTTVAIHLEGATDGIANVILVSVESFIKFAQQKSFFRGLRVEKRDGVHMAVGHAEDVFGLGNHFRGEMAAAVIADIDAELTQGAHRVVAGGLAVHRANAGRCDLDVPAPAHRVPEQPFSHGAAANISRADEQNCLHARMSGRVWDGRFNFETEIRSACGALRSAPSTSQWRGPEQGPQSGDALAPRERNVCFRRRGFPPRATCGPAPPR